MRIGMLTQFFDPEPGPAALPGVLARELVARGHSVRVLTGFPNYPVGTIADGYRVRMRQDESMDGVHVRRVPLYPNHGTSGPKRLANYASFGLSSTAFGLGYLRGADAIWVNCSPITLAWPMWALRALGAPIVSHVLDLWPDSFYATGFGSRIEGGALGAALEAWTSSMYRVSEQVAYISPSVGGLLAERGVARDKLHYVPMWADEAAFRPTLGDREGFDIPSESVVLTYAGALGDAQGLETLIDACRMVDDPRFLCIVAGSGTAEDDLRQRAEGVTNVRFLGRVPQADMASLLGSSDAGYISLRSHRLSSYSLPSKTQALLAAGVPLLVAADGDVVQVARESEAGLVADQNDPASIASAIRSLVQMDAAGRAAMGVAGRRYYERTFSARSGAERVEHLLTEAMGRR